MNTRISDARPRAAPPSDPQLSAAIGIARVMCIMGIVYVHAWTGLDGGQLPLMNDTPQGMLRWALMDLLGRASVPLLSIISGWLVAGSLARRKKWGPFIIGKARTILAPMVLWNAIAILLVSGAAWAGWILAPLPTSWAWTIDELLPIFHANDINVQTPFLRDLFLCMVAAPLLTRLPGAALGALAVVVLGWAVSGFGFALMLRPAILLFFIVGIVARRHDLAARMASRPIALVGGAYLLLAAFQFWLEVAGIDRGVSDPVLLGSADLAMRFTTALFFWAIAWRLAGTRAGGVLLRFEPYAFLMFCSHLIMMWLGGPLIGQVTGPLGSPLYPLFLLIQPVLVVGATLLLGRGLNAVSPSLAALLSGGRIHTVRARPAIDRPRRPARAET